MPPSPSFRRSPSLGRHPDSYKRDHNFKARDDDLALFNEMQSREEDNFLLQPTDDSEDIFSSKVKPFPELRLGISIPYRGESSDLLNAEGGKHDYDWLLTPPDTPLFPSLDDEPTPANLIHNGRARSRPISISRSSTMEKRSSRGSRSPQRLSPSPRSVSSIYRGRSASAPHTTPDNFPSRQITPSRRLSPPLVKPSTPPQITSGSRGASPVRTNLEDSASPKIRAWQSNIPGFSLEVPPNLRTSLADRPATYVRGSSPASRASSSSSKFQRKSMSPTASRSVSSLHSQERDRLSSQSRGSVVSSGDDDADSLQSIPVSINERLMSRKGVSGFSNSKPLAFSKNPTKKFSPSSAPKRSFDSAIRQMDRKIPQNMFRPLLSSVPSPTFYSGKNTAAHRAMISRNSSVTTSSNASSDQATSGAHDTEGSDLYQDVQDEVFAIDEVDVESEDIGLEAHGKLSNTQFNEPDKSSVFASNTCDSEESGIHLCPMLSSASSEKVDMQGDFLEIGSYEKSLLCSICGCLYHTEEVAESEHNICPQCKQKGELLTGHNNEELNKSVPNLAVSSSSVLLIKGDVARAEVHTSPLQSCSDSSLTVPMCDKTFDLAEERRTVLNASHASSNRLIEEMHKGVDKTDSNTDLTETSVAVHRGPLIHGRIFSSSSVSYDNLLNTRDLTGSTRSSGGHCSTSTSSSVDLASVRHGEVVQRQLSGRRAGNNSQHQRSVSSLSGTSVQISQGFGVSTSSFEENHEGSVINMQQIVATEARELPYGAALVSEEASSTKDVSVMVSCTESTELDIFVEKKSEDARNAEECFFVESSSQAENRTMSDSQVDPQCASPEMSEIEPDDSLKIDLVATEDSEDASATRHLDTDAQDLSVDHVDGVLDESIVTVEDREPGERKTRSLTLEEATDAILFCSSIVHDLAYKAATIAIEKEKENLQPLQVARPTITIPEKRSSARHRPTPTATGRKKTQKARKTSPETQPKSPLTKYDDKSNEPVIRNVGGLPNTETMKPPKLESKCNCTVM